MSRVSYRKQTVTRFSRRRMLAIAATAGVGASVAGVAGLSLAGESEAPSGAGPLVISLRDAQKGTFDVFAGATRTTLTDRKLAARLLKAAEG